VASVDGDKKISAFSNRGEKFVDIAAPGCQVPTLSYDISQKYLVTMPMTGTSCSAPQVSWVASMIRAVIDRKPAAFLKARILVGSDIHPNLTKEISEGRVLNPLKALSLSKDVVEVAAGAAPFPQKIMRGTITGASDAKQF